jgi:hypothetical protein
VDNFHATIGVFQRRGDEVVLIVIGGAIAVTGLVWGLLALEDRFTAEITHSEGGWGYL